MLSVSYQVSENQVIIYKMSLEELEKELYGFKKAGRKTSIPKKSRGPDRSVGIKELEVSERWEEPAGKPSTPKKSSWLLWAIILISLAVIIAGVVLIFQYLKGPAEPQIKLEIILPQTTRQGVPFETIINISNQSNLILQDATLVLNLPEGITRLNGSGNASEFRESLGDIGVGGLSKRSFNLLAVENDGKGVKKISAALIYGAGSRERFEQRVSKETVVEGSAIDLEVKVPERILSNSLFEISIGYKNTSNYDFEDLSLELTYPSDFKFSSADLPPTSLNNYWDLGGLRHGSSGSIKIKGSVTAPQQSFFSIPVAISAGFAGQKLPVSKANLSFSIAPSPIELSIAVNNNPEYVARIGDRLSYTINYQNDSGIALADAIIKARLTGELFDVKTLQTKANIDTLTNTLTWNASNVPEFRLLAPGASGSVNFDVRLLSTFPIKRLNDKNYILKVEVTMDSPTVPYYLEAEKTSAAAVLETKTAGLISVDAQAFYRDAQSGILNLGSMPPQVNQPTQYTIHWIIRNYATDVKDVEVKAFLQSGVSWTGFVKSNIDSVPLYNDRTQEIVWNVGRIAAAKGVVGEPVEAIFQIQAVPNSTQINQYQPLISETRIKATDEFTNLQLENFDTAITTSLPDDVTVGQGGGRVIQ